MSLLLVLGLWAVLGRSIYRSRKRSRSMEEHVAGHGGGALDPRSIRADVPDTVPSEWVEEHRGNW
jgi:hypothetical protein